MLRSRVLLACGLAVTLAVLFAVPASAQDKADLVWKFEKDKVFYQQMETTTTQRLQVQGLTVDQNQTQTFYFSWKVTDVKPEEVTLEQKIEGVKMKITIAGNPIEFDSTAASTASPSNNPLKDFFEKLKGSVFKVTFNTKDKKVTKVEAPDFVKNLAAANPQMKSLVEQILNENALKQMADPTFAIVPGKTVNKGESWERVADLNLGPIGSYKNTYKYTYEGNEKQGEKELAKIKAELKMEYTAPAASEAGLPFRIKEAKLSNTPAESTGTILFDPKEGRLERSELNLDLNGDLTIDIGGTSNKVTLKQTQKTIITRLDKLPWM